MKSEIGGKILQITVIKRADVKIVKSKNIEFISADGLTNNFVVRTWKEGDKFFPIGMRGTKKISDYLNDVKINLFEKEKAVDFGK